ncbi:unnamed protein product, partial [Heterosigma akashiwo]
MNRQRTCLPIFKHRESILYAIERNDVVIVVGETGCGKTTQIPQYLHEAGWTGSGKCVVCTQPRRLAAVSVAERVAEELGGGEPGAPGGPVGYAVRFDQRGPADPGALRLKFCTDGLLLRELLRDPLLGAYRQGT